MPMGCDQARWTPPARGRRSTSCRRSCSSLEPVKDTSRSSPTWSCSNAYPGHPRHLERRVPQRCQGQAHGELRLLLGTTVDQIAAKQIGQRNAAAVARAGDGPDPARRPVRQRLRLRVPEQPVVVVADDAAALRSAPAHRVRALFGEGGSAAERRAALARRASLLDSFDRDIARLKQRVGPADRARVDQYLDTVREVERRIQQAEADAVDNTLPDLDRPVGVPAAYADHAKLMFDLQVLAFQADITRVITFQLTRELSNRTYPEIGVSDPHHPLDAITATIPEKIGKIAKINAFHVSLFADFLQKLKATPEGDGTLLDHTVYVYGSGMGNRNMHDHLNLPILVAGGARVGMKGGRHIRYKKAKPLANLHLTLLDKVGVRARFVRRQRRQDRQTCSIRWL